MKHQLRRALNTKYPSVMKKSNPTDVVFKDKTKFDTQNPIISTLLTLIKLGETNEKAIENQLKSAPSINDLQIAGQLERLKQDNRKNNDDDDDYDGNNDRPPFLPSFNLPLCHPPSPSIDEDNSDIENNLNPTKTFLLGDTPQQKKITVAVGEKTTAVVKKVRFLKNLNKLFPKAAEIFNDQKIDVDYDVYQNMK